MVPAGGTKRSAAPVVAKSPEVARRSGLPERGLTLFENRLPELIQPSSTALLVVDMQNDFCHPEGDVGRRGGRVDEVLAMVPALERLLLAARSAGVRVVHTRTQEDDWCQAPSWRASLGDRPLNCVSGSWGAAFYGPLQPQPGELVVTKHRYSAFVGTDLLLMLRSSGIQTVVVTGTKTNVCVDITAKDAYVHDFYVIVAADCCATADGAEYQAAALRLLSRGFAGVVPSAEIISLWAPAGQP